MTNIVFLTPAEEEMRDASQFYERQSQGLGHEFLAEIQRVVRSVVENPHVGTVVRQPIRRRLIRGFPFGILYQVGADEIVIVAVMHLGRRPGYWANRV